MILYKKRTTTWLIRQSRSAGWSAPLLFATLQRQVFSHQGPYNLYVLPIMTQMGPTCNPYGVSHMGPCTTVANTSSVPFGLLLWDTYFIPHYRKKCVSHAIHSHVKPAYYQGDSHAIDSRLLDSTYTHSGDVTSSDVRKSGAILDLGCLSFHHSVCHYVRLSSFCFHSMS